MDKKFTEEQFQAIARAGDAVYEISPLGLLDETTDVEGKLREKAPNPKKSMSFYPSFSGYSKEIVAILNPATRKWAHDQFVEKEKKYYWRYKKTDEDGDAWYLRKDFGLIIPRPNNTNDLFTEKEIIEAGYNPDMYDKEEVE
ncbi:hypothetical protein [Fructobacillus cardui]|uniref:hypothetical protein n=1 Tax=Fructobacillus cardui TaxID=2893170 RepID=UPI00200A2001|nr:hypothetical protein [Fructobacillus cardui]MCK8628112.1 hypothetical protein [Fructobacillus cardui]